ncbi:denticleless protein homolog [Amphiura filiformis]|uniref:denticleless protein homolog n=1 Tax=Amphiura filiformis TaxID=82378 RepID=UPI003B223265
MTAAAAFDNSISQLLSPRAFLGRNQRNEYLKTIPRSLHRITCISEDEHSVLGSQREPGGVPPFACGFGKTSDTLHMLATADEDGHVCLYDTQGVSKLAKEWAAHNNAIFDLKWADTEPWVVTASGDQTAALWDVKRGCRLAVFKQHSSSLKSVSFRPGDRNVFATGARDGRIMMWDIRCNHKEGPPSYHTPVNTIADGHVPTRPTTPKPTKRQRLTPTANSTKSSVTAVVFNDEFSLISAGATESTIKVWDMRTIYKKSSRKPVPKYEYPYCGTSTRNIGFSSLILNSGRSCVYASCTDDVIYAFNCLGVNRYPVACYMGHSNSTFYVKSASQVMTHFF